MRRNLPPAEAESGTEMSDMSEVEEPQSTPEEEMEQFQDGEIEREMRILAGLQQELDPLLADYASLVEEYARYKKGYFRSEEAKKRKFEETAEKMIPIVAEGNPIIEAMIEQANIVRTLQGIAGFTPLKREPTWASFGDKFRDVHVSPYIGGFNIFRYVNAQNNPSRIRELRRKYPVTAAKVYRKKMGVKGQRAAAPRRDARTGRFVRA